MEYTVQEVSTPRSKGDIIPIDNYSKVPQDGGRIYPSREVMPIVRIMNTLALYVKRTIYYAAFEESRAEETSTVEDVWLVLCILLLLKLLLKCMCLENPIPSVFASSTLYMHVKLYVIIGASLSEPHMWCVQLRSESS